MHHFLLRCAAPFAVVLLCLALGPAEAPRYATRLSDYGFFTGPQAEMRPATGVLPYALNSQLFSDYAHKARFVKLPPGTAATYHPHEVLDFPVGTAIAKTFYYPHDFRQPEAGRRLMETRILLRQPDGWVALPYVWNDEQTDAFLDVAGDTKAVTWKDERGKVQKLDYNIPNLNQCKGCHLRGKDIVPIGPSARQLNGAFQYDGAPQNQLAHWAGQGRLTGLPDLAALPAVPDWQDATADLDQRARAYLDINCAHCHHPEGPASTSGLFLHIQEADPTRLGVRKPPVAAGRAAGKRQYSIVPGKPQQSILLFRMESHDPGIMMPELGRQLVHKEGVELIRAWVAAMEP